MVAMGPSDINRCVCKCLFLHSHAGSIFEDVASLYDDDDVASNLQFYGAVLQVNLMDGAVNAASGDYLSTFLQFVLELLNLLALLLLRTDHKEVHDGKDCNHHQQHGHHALAAASSGL